MGSDQKRMFLALGLVVAVMFVYTTFFSEKPKEKPPAPKAKQEQSQTSGKAASTTPATPAQPAKALSPAPAPAPASNEDLIEVDTSLYKAVFSTRGGSLKQVVLKEYYNKPEKKGGNYAVLDMAPEDPYSLGLNLIKADPNLSKRIFSASASSLNVKEGRKELVFTARIGDLTVQKIYTFQGDSYAFDLAVKVINNGSQPVELQTSLSLVEKKTRAEGASYAFTGLTWSNNGKYHEEDAGDLEDNPSDAGPINYMGLSIPYFLGAIAPLDQTDNIPEKRFVRGSEKNGFMEAALVSEPIRLAGGEAKVSNYMIYYGPKDLNILKPLGHDLAKAVDFGWFDIIAKPMLIVLNFIYSFIGNYGVAIIIVTALTKLLFWPLTAKSYKSMKKMQKLQPQIKRLREKYKDDKQRMNQEMMQMYKTYKVNPAGGCLPMVVQIPVFIAFYKVLGTAIELRHAPFLLWINDLAAPDRLPIGIDIPYVGNGIPVLTLLMGASMFLQQKMTPTMGDPTQAKMMMLMPVVFTVMFINFPAGLVLYWLVNNLLGIGQQYMTNRRKD